MAIGNKPLKKRESIADIEKLNCLRCNAELNIKDAYDSDSDIYKAICKIPYCKDCISELYQYYQKKFKKLSYAGSEKKSVERICMICDLYYSDDIFNSVCEEKESKNMTDTSIISLYMKRIKMYQYRNKNYDTTIAERYGAAKANGSVVTLYGDDDKYQDETIKLAKKIFGRGFEDDEYVFLYEEYSDWTSRHECNTKAQEEVFKNICRTQLLIHKAVIAGEDTKDLATQLQKWLDTGKLQPKQNTGDTVSDAQTFGTLIDKWETTRPIPDIDASLEDVDNLGLFVDVLMRGHLAKTAGIDSGYSERYDKFIKEYSVENNEYDDDEDNNAIYEALFGSSLLTNDKDD